MAKDLSYKRRKVKAARERREHGQKSFYLNLTSMVDMFTIILVFLLVSYSITDVALSPPKDVQLPLSIASQMPSISVKVSVSASEIAVEERVVARLSQGRVQGRDVQGLVIVPLFRELKKIVDERSQGGTQMTDRRIILQGDKSIPFSTLKRVLFTAGQAEFEAFRFAVIRKGDLFKHEH